ncbi:chemotaxis protein CheW [Duganella sp. FT92W]|uniref:Chemotaxis protein CheW n=1 Tax=Pseudoduganella rivuli TaxID=2666085 RepID=A0A7X2IN43_9BURK|nr:chemotaxis protein CheW [Pseudoduganella rivuli]MRV72793.1 chemotaxis protein CheW [Pseudoduganella rivuli]
MMGQLNMAATLMIGGKQQYLTFMLGGETYAMRIAGIKEIIPYGGVTAIPCVPDSIRGVINLRGAVVPVIDLGARFGHGALSQVRRSCIVIIEVTDGETGQDIGVMVDAVNAVVEIDDDDVEPRPAFGASVRVEFIQGMGKVNGKFVVILDVGAVLSMDELALLTEMTELAA